MSGLFASGRILDAILAFTVLEAVGLLIWRARGGRAPRVLASLAAGAALLGAARCMIAGAWWGWSAAFLLAGLAAHAVDAIGRRG